jgi:hypothetical protein
MVFSCTLSLLCGAGTLAAASEQKDVNQVLAQEASGIGVNRRQLLADHDDSISQWQSGRILIDGQWKDVEKLDQHELVPNISEYQKKRDAEQLNVEGHRRMARWCQSHQLPEMANVHWKAVLALAVDDEQAHKALRHKKIDEKWFSDEELKEVADEQKAQKTSLKVWMPKVRKLSQKLRASDTQLKLDGMKELEQINTPDAVTSLKYAALQLDPSNALPIVEKIKQIQSKDSCLALCEIAIADPNSEVGRLAIEGLKDYNEHYYVPDLLQMLEVPVALKQQFYYMPNGALVVHNSFRRQTMDRDETLELVKLVALDNSAASSFRGNSGPNNVRNALTQIATFGGIGPVRVDLEVVNKDAQQSLRKVAQLDMKRAKMQAQSHNDERKQMEKRVKKVLSKVSSLPEDAPAESFWQWWPSYNESGTTLAKEKSVQYVVDNSQYVDLVTNYSGYVGVTEVPENVEIAASTPYKPKIERSGNIQRTFALPPMDCLAAGTTIQTVEGLRNVEDLHVGDMVASVDVKTGEIKTQPITQISTRDADTSFTFETADGQQVHATGGHRWWVVGKGWVRTRELAPKMLIRTTEASIEVAKVEKIDKPCKFYNMTVDETHTYFVGKDRLLSWDVTTLQPTLQAVPGQMLVSLKK